MNKKKVLVVFGTRPEAIKMCPLVKELRTKTSIQTVICVTGQHREMLAQVMDAFQLKADYNLDIMKPRQTLSGITVDILTRIEKVVKIENPDLILVHGDTSTSFVAALAGFYARIPVGHVEAGLRTYNMQSPYPEEFNRQAVDLITEMYFAPTETAKDNLLREGKREERIFVTGNTVIDALKTTIRNDYKNENLEWADGSRLLLLTAHRRENLGDPMRGMFQAIKRIVQEFEDVKVIYPIHKNPAVREAAKGVIADIERIRMIEPLDVVDFHNFMSRSYLILTDSGGVQEEAPSLGKPVLVMRDTTERPEGVAAGTLKLVGTREDDIFRETRRLLTDEKEYERMSKTENPYGDGHASERIVQAILEYLEEIF